MVDFIVDILNAISSGISQSQVDDLLKTPAAYNSSMYNLSLSIAQTAVKPVASMVLAIVFTLELAMVSSKVDGDRELGVKMVASAMIRIMLVFTAAQHSELLLKAIDQLGQSVMDSFVSASPTSGDASGLGLGDQMRDDIDAAGWLGQLPCIVLLIIPFLVSKAASIVFTVVLLLRFVQIYLTAAFNPLPIAFIACDETRQWGVNYFRQYATLVFQCATLYLAVVLYRAFVGNVMSVSGYEKDSSLSGWITSNFSNLLLASVLLIGIVMVSNGVAKKLFGGE